MGQNDVHVRVAQILTGDYIVCKCQNNVSGELNHELQGTFHIEFTTNITLFEECKI